MQGTILILEGVATTRIMLKVRLSAGYYRVVQSDCLAGAGGIISRSNPDLILAGPGLTDGSVAEICALRDAAAPGVPVMIITRENDDAARQDALRLGADDAMTPPLQDLLLLARIRRLIRDRIQAEDLRPRDDMQHVLGLSEPRSDFERPARVSVLAWSRSRAGALAARAGPAQRHILRRQTPDSLRQADPGAPGADAILIDFSGRTGSENLRLLSELRSRAATRHAAVIALTDPGNPQMEAEALDAGADDVLPADCDPAELNLRLDRRLEARRQANAMRDTLKRGLRAAVRDPLTGLYNRRFAEPYLARVAKTAETSGRPFAVMLLDIDHFKAINDTHGHQAGDRVIAETARRLQAGLSENDMLARIGGEEFLAVMPDVAAGPARERAQKLRGLVNGRRFRLDGHNATVPVSISIGIVAVPPTTAARTGTQNAPRRTEDGSDFGDLIAAADEALYAAKHTGRNRVSLVTAAA